MVESAGRPRRPSPRSAALVGAAVAASLVVLAGCSSSSSGGDAEAACPAPSAASPTETALLPAGLSFDKIGTVTHVATTPGHLTVQAVTSKPIDEATVLIQDAVTAVGYSPAGMDNEGDEAEVFFTSGSQAAGQARVQKGKCAGQWDIDIDLVPHAAGASPTGTPTST
jgi:hypothetical protein